MEELVPMEATPDDQALLHDLKEHLPVLRELLRRASSHWEYEDPIYRCYHGSFKVFALQSQTTAIVDALRAIRPDAPLNPTFANILSDGTGHTFSPEANAKWDETARPIVEAFFHARFFLEMAVKYGEELDEAPMPMPSGWAALLYFFKMR